MGLPLQSQTEMGVRRAEDQNASANRRRKRVSNLRWTEARVGPREAARRVTAVTDSGRRPAPASAGPRFDTHHEQKGESLQHHQEGSEGRVCSSRLGTVFGLGRVIITTLFSWSRPIEGHSARDSGWMDCFDVTA